RGAAEGGRRSRGSRDAGRLAGNGRAERGKVFGARRPEGREAQGLREPRAVASIRWWSFANADKERADPFARAFRVAEAADHDLMPLDALRLEPGPRAAGGVRQVAALRHDALEPESTRLGEHALAIADRVVRVADHVPR